MVNYILEMRNIRKTFLGDKVVANDDVTLKIKKGEKHAIVGENGAGKSTLMQILNGLYQPTSGEIYFHGNKVEINGLNYALDRLPKDIEQCSFINLTSDEGLKKTSFKPIIPKKKKQERGNHFLLYFITSDIIQQFSPIFY